ncbi:MAG TPA: transposase [Nitrososphaerales archaeon]|nr:transposase [Nitrososphaerales archaeon]
MISAVKEYFRLPYGQAEGFADLLGGMWGASIPSYSQICRRQKTLNIPLDIKKNYDGDQLVDTIIDSSGLKVSNRGEWMRRKWKVRRGSV